jgi:glutathione S-transferase
MVQLVDSDIRTREVLGWKGVHVLHYSGSSVLAEAPHLSQSQRHRRGRRISSICIRTRTSSRGFLGINPRGLVPVLVHDGAVHIESNDIIQHLEKTFPGAEARFRRPRKRSRGLAPARGRPASRSADLELPLCVQSARPPKPAAALESYAVNGSGTVQGARDRDKEIQIEFWQRAAKEGFSDERVCASARKFRAEFDALDRRLAQSPYLMGHSLSVLDIAWFIYAYRLSLAGYPLRRLHPRVGAWEEKLRARPEFVSEIAGTRKPATPVDRTLEQVTGF